MSAEKRRIGFNTSGTDAEDTFNKIKEELSKEKADWQFIGSILNNMTQSVSQETLKDNSNTDMNSVILLFVLSCNVLVTGVGIELKEIHEKLARIEKDIKTIKLK